MCFRTAFASARGRSCASLSESCRCGLGGADRERGRARFRSLIRICYNALSMNTHEHMQLGSLSAQAVANFETHNGIELPADYRAYLLAEPRAVVPEANFYWVVPD